MISATTSLLVLIYWSEALCEIPDHYPSLSWEFGSIHPMMNFIFAQSEMIAGAVLIRGPEIK